MNAVPSTFPLAGRSWQRAGGVRHFRSSARACSLFQADEYPNGTYDTIIVGGGHAGCEAVKQRARGGVGRLQTLTLLPSQAAASVRAGARTLLVTHKIETIGECAKERPIVCVLSFCGC